MGASKQVTPPQALAKQPSEQWATRGTLYLFTRHLLSKVPFDISLRLFYIRSRFKSYRKMRRRVNDEKL